MESATHVGVSGVPGDGPYAIVYLKVAEGVIEKASFKTPGCPSSTLAGSVLCALIAGREAKRAAALTPEDLSAVVGPLPEGKGHIIGRLVEALQDALKEMKE